jgi:hypothetical protein
VRRGGDRITKEVARNRQEIGFSPWPGVGEGRLGGGVEVLPWGGGGGVGQEVVLPLLSRSAELQEPLRNHVVLVARWEGTTWTEFPSGHPQPSALLSVTRRWRQNQVQSLPPLSSCFSHPGPTLAVKCQVSSVFLIKKPNSKAWQRGIGQPSSPRPCPTPTGGQGATFPKLPRLAPIIPHLGMAAPPSPQAGPTPRWTLAQVPAASGGVSLTAHMLARGCPFQPGKAQVGRGEAGRSLRGFQSGNQTERTNPASMCSQPGITCRSLGS